MRRPQPRASRSRPPQIEILRVLDRHEIGIRPLLEVDELRRRADQITELGDRVAGAEAVAPSHLPAFATLAHPELRHRIGAVLLARADAGLPLLAADRPAVRALRMHDHPGEARGDAQRADLELDRLAERALESGAQRV